MPLGSFRLNTLAKSFISGAIEILTGVFSTGRGSDGQLGLTTVAGSTNSVFLYASNDFIKISSKSAHALGIKSDGTLWAWGSNANARTGLGITTGNTLVPTQVGTDNDWVKVSAGVAFSLAIKSDGTLWAWGSNASGATGLGITSGNTLVPTQVGTSNNWATIATGSAHSLAVTTTGQLWAWGINSGGQLGRGNTTSPQTTPVRIGSATNWAEVSAGYVHSHGITTNNQLWSWGVNASGRLGDGTTTTRTRPVRIATGSNWQFVSAGESSSMAITTTGQLWGWGNDQSGNIGIGSTTTQRTSPVRVGTDSDWLSVAAGESLFPHTLAIKSNGTLWAWGNNSGGRTGLGITSGNTLVPTQVGTDNDWAAISAASAASLAIKSDGSLLGCGANASGQLGIRTQIENFERIPNLNNVSKISCGSFYSLALTTSGEIYSWGSNINARTGLGVSTGNTRVPTQVGTSNDWIKVIAGQNFALAIRSNGTVWAWGSNASGATGRGTTFGDTLNPTLVPVGSEFIEIGAGNAHALAIRNTGPGIFELWAWGLNSSGQLGRGNTTSPQTTPVRIGSDTDWAEVIGGGSYSLAIKTNGTLWAWGSNDGGITGLGVSTGNTLDPTQVGTDNDWQQVSASKGGLQSLAIKTNGTLWSWGYNLSGATGLGITTGNTLVPTQVGTDNDWVKVIAGEEHSLAIKSNGTVWAWGRNNNGQLGDGSLINRSSPVLVTASSNWVDIAAGQDHSLIRSE